MFVRSERFLSFMEFLLISIYSFLYFSHIWSSACWYLMIVLLSFGIGLAWIFIVSTFGYYSAAVFISLIFNSVALMMVEGYFLNPSFLPFFTICSVIGLCLTFSNISVSRNRYWMATCFLLGLSIQIHFNAFFILLSGIFLQLISHRIKINQLNKRYFFTGLIIFILTILPYYVSNILSNYGIIIGQQPPFSSGHFINATPVLLVRLFYGLSNTNLDSILRMLMFQLQPARRLLGIWSCFTKVSCWKSTGDQVPWII